MKKTIVKITCLMVLLVLTACSIDSSEDEASIKILAGNQEIHAITYDGEDIQTIKEFEEIHHMELKNNSWDDLPYIPLNETIEINNLNVTELVIEDYILNKNGNLKYAEDVVESYTIPVSNGKASFKLQMNGAEFFSSNSDDYLPGNTIRGFIVHSNSTPIFSFILRTDPSD